MKFIKSKIISKKGEIKMRVNRYDQDEKNTKFHFHLIKRSLKYVKPYRWKLILVTIISCLNGILILLNPKLIQYAIDNTIPNKDLNQLYLIAALLLTIIVINILINLVKSRMLNRVKQSIAYDLKSDIFIHLQYLPSNYYETRPHGKILTRATSYAETVAQSLCNDLLETILELINLTFVVIFMLTCHVPLTLFTLMVAGIIALILFKTSPKRREKQQILNNKVANCNAYFAESINGISITQSYNREEKNEQIFKGLERERVKAIGAVLPYMNMGWAIADAAYMTVKVSIFLLGIFLFYPGISLGTILAIASYGGQFWDPIHNITSVYSEIMDAITYLERIFELLDEPLVIENVENATTKKIDGKVEFKHVEFEYIEDKNVLKDINFTIEPNQKIAFVGETGSGKSTIISLLARYYDTTKGEILIDDIPIREMDLSSLRSQINVMLQDNYVFSRSIKENIAYGKKEVCQKEIEKVCKELQIHDWIQSLKNGYDTILHNNGKEISTGQRQLICFARAIIANPQILILDEATSNVDLKTEKLVQEGLDTLLKNRTSVIIAHRLSTITNCDQIMLLKNHKIYEKGTHQELMEKKGAYYKLYTSQLQ